MSLETYYRRELERERDKVEKLREFVAKVTQCRCLPFANGICYRCKTLADTKGE